MEKVMFGYRTDTQKEKWISDIVSVLKDKQIHAPLEVFICYMKGFSQTFAHQTTQELGERIEKELDASETQWIILKPFVDISLKLIRRIEGKSNQIDIFKSPNDDLKRKR